MLHARVPTLRDLLLNESMQDILTSELYEAGILSLEFALDTGTYNDDLYFCTRCHRGHWWYSRVGKDHESSFKLTSAMWKDFKEKFDGE